MAKSQSGDMTDAIPGCGCLLVIFGLGTVGWTYLEELRDRFSSPERVTERLQEAVSRQDLAQVRRLLWLGPKPLDSRSVCLGAAKGFTEGLKLLLTMGGLSAKQKCPYDTAPLHAAVICGHHDVVKMLIDAGADVNGKAWQGQTPLHTALCVEPRKEAIAKLLVDAGASDAAQNESGISPANCLNPRIGQCTCYVGTGEPPKSCKDPRCGPLRITAFTCADLGGVEHR